MKLSYQQGNILQSDICYILGQRKSILPALANSTIYSASDESISMSEQRADDRVSSCVEKQLVMGMVQQPPLNATR